MTREELAELIMKFYFFYEAEEVNVNINSEGDITITAKSFLKL